ncbi:MAG TPA: MbnP family protein [Chitinophagaceae bacterium]|nr:MbnP family protein [Chitinophagaceae bacterium]
MRTNRFLFTCFLLLGLTALFSSCQKELSADTDEPAATHDLIIRFNPAVDGNALVFGDPYTNPSGEPYTISAFKFYISHIRLTHTDSNRSYAVKGDEYFLVNFADNASTLLQLKAVPSGYNSVSFLLGVDSIRNVSGAQTGALDPAKGMFWTWNSGYIMAKLEGNTPVSSQPNNAFEYHIGGFSGPDNTLKQISLTFPQGQEMKLETGKTTTMTITADANAWFGGPNNIQLSVTPVCIMPGPLARQISENYAGMFTVTDIVNQ